MNYKVNYHGTQINVGLIYGQHTDEEIVETIDNHFKDLIDEYKNSEVVAYDVAGDIGRYEEYGIALNTTDYEKARQSFKWEEQEKSYKYNEKDFDTIGQYNKYKRIQEVLSSPFFKDSKLVKGKDIDDMAKKESNVFLCKDIKNKLEVTSEIKNYIKYQANKVLSGEWLKPKYKHFYEVTGLSEDNKLASSLNAVIINKTWEQIDKERNKEQELKC